jgi:hypothetical protein
VQGGQERVEKSAQKIITTTQEAEELPQIETGGEQCVRAVSASAFEPVAVEQAVVFSVADDRLNYHPPFQPAFNLIGDGDRHMRRSSAPLSCGFTRGFIPSPQNKIARFRHTSCRNLAISTKQKSIEIVRKDADLFSV